MLFNQWFFFLSDRIGSRCKYSLFFQLPFSINTLGTFGTDIKARFYSPYIPDYSIRLIMDFASITIVFDFTIKIVKTIGNCSLNYWNGIKNWVNDYVCFDFTRIFQLFGLQDLVANTQRSKHLLFSCRIYVVITIGIYFLIIIIYFKTVPKYYYLGNNNSKYYLV